MQALLVWLLLVHVMTRSKPLQVCCQGLAESLKSAAECRNVDPNTGRKLMFTERRELGADRKWQRWKLDLHTPDYLRAAGQLMTKEEAAEAAGIWLKILKQHNSELVPLL